MSTGDQERPAQDYPADPGLPPPPPPGYPGAPRYYPVYDPYRPVPAPGTNGKAIASLVLSVTGWLCCAPLALVGLILGAIALRETKRTGQDGYGMALAGTIIGGLFVAAGLIVMLFYIALMVSGWQWT
ncbi:DUF4190 domain-containing protein [Mycobacterium sp. 2YAF39]|uniref:DUF4190 domain-containing protein n=1 Tax=Mycobacterium sp. 2YAF39 TaxID=3233033 RepID=UPI003F9782D5